MKKLFLSVGMLAILTTVALGQRGRIILPNQIGTAPTQPPPFASGKVIYPQNPVPTGGYGQATSQGSYPIGAVPVQMNPSPAKGGGNGNQPLILPVFIPFVPPLFPGLGGPVAPPLKFGVGGGGGGINGFSGGY